jgi:hypothetical protein
MMILPVFGYYEKYRKIYECYVEVEAEVMIMKLPSIISIKKSFNSKIMR